MKQPPKNSADDKEVDAMIKEFLKKGGKVTVGKTKDMPSELGLSNNTWGVKLTKAEKDARNKK